MKRFNDFLNESEELYEEMEPEQFLEDAKNAAVWLKRELFRMFPEQLIESNIDHILGYTLSVSVHSVPSNATDLERANAKSKVNFMMNLTDRFGKSVPMSKFTFELFGRSYARDYKKWKYRKITGKTPMEATKKLLVWIKSNREALLM